MELERLREAIAEAESIPPCQVSDPDLWFAEQSDNYSSLVAKRLCKQCPVINECLAYAMASKERYGVWGGKTARERMRIRGK